MSIMAASMEFSGCDRFKGTLDGFVHRKSIHVGAQAYAAISLAFPLKDADDARSADAAVNFDPPRRKETSDYVPRTVFLEADFGVCMKIVPDSYDFWQKLQYFRRYTHFFFPRKYNPTSPI